MKHRRNLLLLVFVWLGIFTSTASSKMITALEIKNTTFID